MLPYINIHRSTSVRFCYQSYLYSSCNKVAKSKATSCFLTITSLKLIQILHRQRGFFFTITESEIPYKYTGSRGEKSSKSCKFFIKAKIK